MTRLPTPHNDAGQWGNILNDYLSVSHAPDGKLNDGVVASSHLAPNTVTTDKLQNGAVTLDKLASSLQTTLSTVVTTSNVGKAGGIASLGSDGLVPNEQLPAAHSGSVPLATNQVSGTITLSGDLGGTASAPVVAKLGGISLSGTPQTGYGLVATSPTSASWKELSMNPTNPTPSTSAGILWNTTTDPADTGASTASSVQDGDMWVDRRSDSTNVLTKARVNGVWVTIATTLKTSPDPTPTPSDTVTGLTVTNPTSTSLTLSWMVPANPTGTITEYYIYNNGTRLTTQSPVTTPPTTLALPTGAYSLTVAAVIGGQAKGQSQAVTGTVGTGTDPGTGTGAQLPSRIVNMWHNALHPQGIAISNYPADVKSLYNFVSLGMAQGAGDDGSIAFGSSHAAQDAQDIKALVASGIHVALGIGGEGSSTRLMTTANADVMFNNISALKEQYGFNGIDFDIENTSVFTPEAMVYLGKKLKATFGKDFAIVTTPSLYGTIQEYYIKVAQQLGDDMDLMAPMLYGFPEALDSRLSQVSLQKCEVMASAGVPDNKMILGYSMYYGDPSQNRYQCTTDPQIVLNAYKAVRAVRPTIRGIFIYDDNQEIGGNFAGTKAVAPDVLKA